MMAQYRNKPIVIEAWLNNGELPPPSWVLDAMLAGKVWSYGGKNPYFMIRTLEWEMRADHGDWVIQGVNGELYPCKPDVFTKTYDPA